MEPMNATVTVLDYAALQGRLVRMFLDLYMPKDLQRFRDVPNGEFVMESVVWKHTRHGVGVLFVSEHGVRVNAHLAMAAHPRGLDGGRVFEYLHSKTVRSLCFNDLVYVVDKAEMDRLLLRMAECGVLSLCNTGGSFPHHVYEFLPREP